MKPISSKSLILFLALAAPLTGTAGEVINPLDPGFREIVQHDAEVVLEGKSRGNAVRQVGEKLAQHLFANRAISPLEFPPTCVGVERECVNFNVTGAAAAAMVVEIEHLAELIPELKNIAGQELLVEGQASSAEIYLSPEQKLQQIEDSRVLQEIIAKRGVGR